METIALIIIGVFGGFLLFWLFYRYKIGGFQVLSAHILQQAERESDQIKHQAELKIAENEIAHQRQMEKDRDLERNKKQKEEERLKQREDKLEQRMTLFEQKISHIEKREKEIAELQKSNERHREELESQQRNLLFQLEKTSGLTKEEAKNFLLQSLIDEVKTDGAQQIRKIQKETEENAQQLGARILCTAINRLAVSCVSETTTHTVNLANPELKGRIIGREGRNIRLLERLTGVNFLIDDTPNAVVISGFDPIRLHIAKTALNKLVADGRIHPTSIEESIEFAKTSIDEKIRQYGEEAAFSAGQMNLNPELIKLLGSLKFRHSYGQNILDHSLEVSHLMGMIASELRLDANLAKRIGLLHDIGKAVSHQEPGTHALIGYEIAIKYGESVAVANGIGCHHNEMEPVTLEGSFCGAADALSASRPGARLEPLQQYVQRLQKLEDLAYEFPGIDKAYAMQAGREVVISVLPDMIDDAGALNLAKDISKKIEKEMQYPGKIKITVVREKRSVEYAV
jgi:ribonucrease Y